MENVSNALLIAATALVAIILLSIGAYLFSQYGSYSKDINDSLIAKQEEEFNAQYTKYDGIETCRAHDVVTIVNLAKENNYKYIDVYLDTNFDSVKSNLKGNWPYYISVSLAGCDTTFNSQNFERADKTNPSIYTDFIKKYDIDTTTNNAITFKCKVLSHSDIRRVYKVEFTKNT